MDINSIANKSDLSLRAQQQIKIEQISALVKTLGLKTGDQFIAQVEKVTQASPAERTELLKSIEATLAQLNKGSSAPAVQAVLAQLQEQKVLVQASNVKLINLTVSNPQQTTGTNPQSPASTTVLSYSTMPVTVGQTLLLQLTANQRIQILEPISNEQLNKAMGLITSLQNNSAPSASSLSLLDALRSVQQGSKQEQLVAKAGQAISESLRQLLPVKDRGQDMLENLPKLTQFIQQLPHAARKEWLSNELQGALKTLANQIRLSDQLTNPKLLEAILNNNGQRFEQKLARLVGTDTPAHQSSPLTSSKPMVSMENTPKILNAGIAPSTKAIASILATGGVKNTPPEMMANGKSLDANVAKLITQDLKGALLGVLQQLEHERTTSSAASLIPISETGKLNLAGALPQLLAFMMQKQPTELSQKQLRAQLVMLMHQYTLGSLAKIQLQQAHTLSHQLTQIDQPQPTQSWQMEIPVRHGYDVHQLSIQFEQKWVEDPDDNDEKETKRVRQWNVMLGFDLPVLGHFYAQLALLGERLSVKFWAEQEKTLQQAQTRLDAFKQQLEKEGIQIAQLQCLPGLPPSPKMSLNYSLVDVKT